MPQQFLPTTVQSDRREASLPPTAIERARESNTSPYQSPRHEKSPPERTLAARSTAARLQPAASPQTQPHPQIQTKNPVPPPDISSAAQTEPPASRSRAAFPDRSPPEKHPAVVSVPPSRSPRPAQTALPPNHLSTLVPIVRDENIPPSGGQN